MRLVFLSQVGVVPAPPPPSDHRGVQQGLLYFTLLFTRPAILRYNFVGSKFVYPCFRVRVRVAERRFIETCTYAGRHQNITNFTYPPHLPVSVSKQRLYFPSLPVRLGRHRRHSCKSSLLLISLLYFIHIPTSP